MTGKVQSTERSGIVGRRVIIASCTVVALLVVGAGWLWISFRRAEKLTQTICAMKQIALAFESFHAEHHHFPARAIFSKDGKPLLSWRVALLPYLDQKELYERFHLDEPWDSEHNKPLIALIPPMCHDPRDDGVAEGHTRFVVLVGKNTIFDGDKSCTVEDIADGESNTVLFLEVSAARAVIWTKPDDLEFDPQQPLAGLVDGDDSSFLAAFADCHVQRIRRTIDPEQFRRLIIRNDGLPIDAAKD